MSSIKLSRVGESFLFAEPYGDYGFIPFKQKAGSKTLTLDEKNWNSGWHIFAPHLDTWSPQTVAKVRRLILQRETKERKVLCAWLPPLGKSGNNLTLKHVLYCDKEHSSTSNRLTLNLAPLTFSIPAKSRITFDPAAGSLEFVRYRGNHELLNQAVLLGETNRVFILLRGDESGSVVFSCLTDASTINLLNPSICYFREDPTDATKIISHTWRLLKPARSASASRRRVSMRLSAYPSMATHRDKAYIKVWGLELESTLVTTYNRSIVLRPRGLFYLWPQPFPKKKSDLGKAALATTYWTLNGEFDAVISDEEPIKQPVGLLCGVTGNDNLKLNISGRDEATQSIISFHPNNPALIQGSQLVLGAKTAYVSVNSMGYQHWYCSKPSGTEFFLKPTEPGTMPNPVEPTPTEPGQTDGFLWLFECPEGRHLQSPGFPFAPLWGTDPGNVAASQVVQTTVLAPARKKVLRNVQFSPSVSKQLAVSPQGWLGTFSNLTWDRLTLGFSRDLKNVRSEVTLTAAGTQLADVLSSSELFLATSDFATIGIQAGQNRISVREWTFDLPTTLENDLTGAIIVVKSSKRSLQDLIADKASWDSMRAAFPNEPQFVSENVRDRLIKIASNASGSADPNLQSLRCAFTESSWNGFIVFHHAFDPKKLPEDLDVLASGFKNPVFIDHIGFKVNEPIADGNVLGLKDSSIFGLISYFDPSNARAITNSSLSPMECTTKTEALKRRRTGDFSFLMRSLIVGFTNSAISHFSARLEIKNTKFLGEYLNSSKDTIALDGHYEKHDDDDKYTFSSTDAQQIEPVGSVYQSVTVTRARLEINRISQVAICRFALCGFFSFRMIKMVADVQYPIPDAMPFDRLAFNDLGLVFDVDSSRSRRRTENGRTDTSRMSLDPKQNQAREEGWTNNVPADIREILASSKDKIDLASMGFLPLGTNGSKINYGFTFEVNLGDLGKLIYDKFLKDLVADIVVGWKELTSEFVLGIRFKGIHGKSSYIGIQNVLALHYKEIRLELLANKVVMLRLHCCYLDILGQDIPPTIHPTLYLLGSSKNFGWYLGYQSDTTALPWFMLVASHNVSIDGSDSPDFAGVFPRLRDTALLLNQGCSPNEQENDEKVAEAFRTKLSLTSQDWMVACDLNFKLVRLGILFRDPDLYGLLLGVKGFRELEIYYQQFPNGIGMWGSCLDFSAMGQVTIGSFKFRPPRLCLSIFTNGGYIVDLGFPHDRDFSKSAAVKLGPFEGQGGFLFGITTGVPTQWKGKLSKIVFQAGIGVKFAYVRSISAGPFKAGLSVAIYSIIQGALGYQNEDFVGLEPATWAFSGTLGAIFELYGSVRFGSLTASLNLRLYAEATVEFGKYIDGSPERPFKVSLDAGYYVKVEVRYKFHHWGIHFEISIFFEISGSLHIEWPEDDRTLLTLRSPFTWDETFVYDAALPALPLQFIPHISKHFPSSAQSGQLQCTATIALEDHSLKMLVEAVLAWTLFCAGIEETDSSNNPTQIVPDDITAIYNVLHNPVSLAHSDTTHDTASPSPTNDLSKTIIRDFLLNNFAVSVNSPVDDIARPARATYYFPVLNDMKCHEANNSNATSRIQTHSFDHLSSIGFENHHMDAYNKLNVIYERPPLQPQGAVMFSDLILQDYFDVLVKSVIKAAENYLIDPSTPNPANVHDVILNTAAKSFESIGQHINRMFLSGQRVIDGLNELTLLEASGQSFRLNQQNADPYFLVFENNGAMAALQLDTSSTFLSDLQSANCPLDEVDVSRAQIVPSLTSQPFSYQTGRGNPWTNKAIWALPDNLLVRVRKSGGVSLAWQGVPTVMPVTLLELRIDTKAGVNGLFPVKPISPRQFSIIEALYKSSNQLNLAASSYFVSVDPQGAETVREFSDAPQFVLSSLSEEKIPGDLSTFFSAPPRCVVPLSDYKALIEILYFDAQTNQPSLFVYTGSEAPKDTVFILLQNTVADATVQKWHTHLYQTQGIAAPNESLKATDPIKRRFELSAEPGCVQFIVPRHEPSLNNSAQSTLLQLYSLLDYRLIGREDLQISPIMPEVFDEESRARNFDGTWMKPEIIALNEWIYRATFPLYKFKTANDKNENPYLIIGTDAEFILTYRDVYGNRPKQGHTKQLAVRQIKYTDPLISLSEIPFLRLTYDLSKSATPGNLFTLSLNFHFSPNFDGSAKEFAKKLVKRCVHQYDPQNGFSPTLQMESPILKTGRTIENSKIRTILEEILAHIDSNQEYQPTPLSFDFAEQQLTDAFYAPDEFSFTVERSEQDVDQSYPVDARAVIMRCATSIAPANPMFQERVEKLEEIFANAPTPRIVAAETERIWLIQKSVITTVNFQATMPHFYGLPPLSNKPWSGKVLVTTGDTNDPCALTQSIAPVDGLDADHEFHRCLLAIDNLLDSKNLRSALILDSYWTTPNNGLGWTCESESILNRLIQSRRTLAEKLAARLMPIMADDLPTAYEHKTAVRVIENALSSKLSSAYTIDAVAQVTAETDPSYAGITLYGNVRSSSSALTCSNARLDMSEGESLVTWTITTDKRQLSVTGDFVFDVTHLEITNEGSPTWVRLVKKQTLNIGAAEVPTPQRQLPPAPAIVSQSANDSEVDLSLSRIDNARLWLFECESRVAHAWDTVCPASLRFDGEAAHDLKNDPDPESELIEKLLDLVFNFYGGTSGEIPAADQSILMLFSTNLEKAANKIVAGQSADPSIPAALKAMQSLRQLVSALASASTITRYSQFVLRRPSGLEATTAKFGRPCDYVIAIKSNRGKHIGRCVLEITHSKDSHRLTPAAGTTVSLRNGVMTLECDFPKSAVIELPKVSRLLDIVYMKAAWYTIRTMRNIDLISERMTNHHFVCASHEVGSVQPLKPNWVQPRPNQPQPIFLHMLKEPIRNESNYVPQKRWLLDYIKDLFAEFFKKIPGLDYSEAPTLNGVRMMIGWSYVFSDDFVSFETPLRQSMSFDYASGDLSIPVQVTASIIRHVAANSPDTSKGSIRFRIQLFRETESATEVSFQLENVLLPMNLVWDW